jgi:hypothetical protein
MYGERRADGRCLWDGGSKNIHVGKERGKQIHVHRVVAKAAIDKDSFYRSPPDYKLSGHILLDDEVEHQLVIRFDIVGKR